MTNKRPTDDELTEAFAKTKAVGFRSSRIKQTDEGAAMMRHFLPPEWHSLSLDAVRQLAQNHSRSGKEPGVRKRKASCKGTSAIKALRKAYPPKAEDFSPEYHYLHASAEYKNHRDDLKYLLGYRCQGCVQQYVSEGLEGHILDYSRWDQPGMMLILCEECHDVLDCLRRRGKQRLEDESNRKNQKLNGQMSFV